MGSNVARTESYKYLGVTLTNTLKWDTHISNTCQKAFKQLGFLRRKLATAPPNVKLSCYKSLVRPILEYGSVVWDPYQVYLINKLEAIQNKALRFIYSRYSRNDSVTLLRNRAAIQTLETRRRVASLKLMYLLYHDKLAVNKNDYLKEPYQRSSRLNHTKCIRPYITRCDTYKFSFFPFTIEKWNALPHACMNVESLEAFTAKIEQFIFV